MTFRVDSGNRNAKAIRVTGPLDLEIDRDDVDTAFVDEVTPALVAALNASPTLAAAIQTARANQRARHAREE